MKPWRPPQRRGVPSDRGFSGKIVTVTAASWGVVSTKGEEVPVRVRATVPLSGAVCSDMSPGAAVKVFCRCG